MAMIKAKTGSFVRSRLPVATGERNLQQGDRTQPCIIVLAIAEFGIETPFNNPTVEPTNDHGADVEDSAENTVVTLKLVKP